LEVAVGTGLAFYKIVKRNPHGNNIGFDLSMGMLEKAKQPVKEMLRANYRLHRGHGIRTSRGIGIDRSVGP
jgi:ubiquinone/menaquinone biosynthesis C-methylase UbiE